MYKTLQTLCIGIITLILYIFVFLWELHLNISCTLFHNFISFPLLTGVFYPSYTIFKIHDTLLGNITHKEFYLDFAFLKNKLLETQIQYHCIISSYIIAKQVSCCIEDCPLPNTNMGLYKTDTAALTILLRITLSPCISVFTCLIEILIYRSLWP